MSYIEENLLSDEILIYQSRLHWIIFLQPLFWIIIGLVFYELITAYSSNLSYLTEYNRFYYMASYNRLIILFFKYIAYVPIFLGLLGLFFAYVRYLTTEFGVTNKRVIVKVGFISRATSENFLQKVENIQVGQTFWGRIFNYGTIIVIGTGGTQEPFDYINDPLMFRRQVQAQVEKAIEK